MMWNKLITKCLSDSTNLSLRGVFFTTWQSVDMYYFGRLPHSTQIVEFAMTVNFNNHFDKNIIKPA